MIKTQEYINDLVNITNVLRELELDFLELPERDFDPVEPVFNVDLNSRKITVPPEFNELAVYMDHRAETIWFAVDRYFDGVDLSENIAYGIQYKRADGKEGLLPFNQGKVVSSDGEKMDLLMLGWSIPVDVTCVIGELELSLIFFFIDEPSGNVTYTLNTKPFTTRIGEGFYITDDSNLGSPPKDNLNELVSRIEKLYFNDGGQLFNYTDINRDTLPTFNGVRILGNLSTNKEKAIENLTDKIDISYKDLIDLPSINGVALVGNKTDAELGIRVTVDQTINAGSVNPVSGGAVYSKFSEVNSDIDKLWEELDGMTFIPLSISDFKHSYGYAEKGSSVNNMAFEWKLSGTAASLTLNDQYVDPLATSTELNNLNLTENTKFTLVGKDRKDNAATATTDLIFTYRVYSGAAAAPSEYNTEFINSLNSVLQVSKESVIDVNATTDKFIYYAVPAEYGECTFTSGGFTGGFTKVATISHTNEFDVTADYDIYKSDYAGLGQTSVVIS